MMMRVSILIIGVACLQLSCGQQAGVVVNSFSVRPIAGNLQHKAQLSQDAGFVLSGTARVLYVDDGGGSGPKYQYMEWVLFDPGGFDLGNFKDVLELKATTGASIRDAFESRIPHLKGAEFVVKAAIRTESAGFGWRIYVVKAGEGEYLYVSRMKLQ